MSHKLMLLILIFVVALLAPPVCAADGNGTPALKSVRVGIVTPDTSWTDDTRAEFDSGNTQWWADE